MSIAPSYAVTNPLATVTAIVTVPVTAEVIETAKLFAVAPRKLRGYAI